MPHRNSSPTFVSILGWMLTILFLPAFCMISSAQVINGQVKGNAGVLSGAIITNCSTKKTSVSDGVGYFQIKASNGDTLITRFFNYNPDTTVVATRQFVLLKLKDVTLQLKEVLIKGTKLSPLEQYHKNQEDYKQIYRLGDMSDIVSFSGGLGRTGIGLNIDALYNALSKQGRNARKLQRTLTNDYYNAVVDSRFTTTLVSKVTGYQGQQLEDFIINNRPSYAFVANASDYEIIEYIKRKVNGISLKSDAPAPSKPKSEGFHIIYKPDNHTYDSRPSGASYIPIHP